MKLAFMSPVECLYKFIPDNPQMFNQLGNMDVNVSARAAAR
jgi:hypothetical protein